MPRLPSWTLTLACGLAAAGAARPVDAASDPASATVMIRVVGQVTAAVGTDARAWRPSVELREVRLGTGSGVIISPEGYIVTNAHVIGGRKVTALVEGRVMEITLAVQRIEVVVPGSAEAGTTTQVLEATAVVEDQELDLAVLHVGAQDLPYLVLSDGTGLGRGDAVTAWGYPLGDQLRVETPDGVETPPVSASAGSVAALRAGGPGLPSTVPYVQTTAPLNPGNSGGPLTDSDGYVVGIVQAKLTKAEGVGFAIGAQAVRECLERRAMDGVLPVTRLAQGSPFELATKGLRLRPPAGFADASTSRLRVHSGESLGPVVVVIDRVATPLPAAAVERALLDGTVFGGPAAVAVERRLPVVPGQRGTLALARTTAGGRDTRLLYAVIEAGTEKVVARVILSADDLAYNLGVLCEALSSLEVVPLISQPVSAPLGRRLMVLADTSGPISVVPAGTVVERTNASGCPGLAEPAGAIVATPEGDFTVRFVATWWPRAVSGAAARAACGGSGGDGGSRGRVSHLGVAYVLESRVAESGGVAVRLEVWAPERKAAFAADAFAAWAAAISATAPRSP